MTFVSYILDNGTTVKTLAAAKASGCSYKVQFDENPNREYLNNADEKAYEDSLRQSAIKFASRL